MGHGQQRPRQDFEQMGQRLCQRKRNLHEDAPAAQSGARVMSSGESDLAAFLATGLLKTSSPEYPGRSWLRPLKIWLSPQSWPRWG